MNSSTKVVFLDIDGVLNSYTFAEQMSKDEGVSVFREDILDKHCIAILARLVQETGAIIVLSSAWRRIPDARAHAAAQLAEFGLTIDSDTPYTGLDRGCDIGKWLHSHPEVEQYVILDDDMDMGKHISHLVQTSFYGKGLTMKEYELARQMLKTKRKEKRNEPQRIVSLSKLSGRAGRNRTDLSAGSRESPQGLSGAHAQGSQPRG